ncbi:MAG TPA: CoA transferase [Caulobacteraceae bacterium]|jgi:crotonobetainyl-CoA:carnitine CoA-transferase CaiB-like acyl-CoA transferase
MNNDPVATIMARLAADVAEASGGRVDVAAMGVTSRAGHLPLAEPGRISPNGACRLVRCADGWIAVNLAREEDAELIPAWLGLEDAGDPWAAIEAGALVRTAAAAVADASVLGIPVARVGEVQTHSFAAQVLRNAPRGAPRRLGRVVDVSALWAGPLCGAILAAAGAEVLKIESHRRPDPSRAATPEFFKRLNGMKMEVELDLADERDQKRLFEAVSRSDVLITSARPRAFPGIGLEPAAVFAANRALTWVSITGHGAAGAAAERVAFGDDAAAAGGLVRWEGEEPRFLGDALADPITGQAAAVAALKALETGGGAVVDIAMARASAAAAHLVKATT